MNKKFTCKFVSAIVAALIIMGALGSTVSALASSVSAEQNDKEDFKYVALGASNVVGYGLHGYNFERVYEAPFEKEVENRYGYKMDTPGAYPVLIKEKLSENYNVDLSLIGTSSMRAEEIRMLLDNDYWGDSYTDTWFYDTNGDGKSRNWSSGAALYEWKLRADAGLPGYDHTPTNAEAFQVLRDATVKSVTEADLITIDAGMNNFGTYMINLLSGGVFTNDLSHIDPEIDKYYDMARDYILGIVKNQIDIDALPEEMIARFTDTFAYAMVGYCYNMDAIVERIYELNPDVEIVMISIQNMMRDLDIVFPGYDGTLPFGDIFGAVVNAANLYTAIISPYSDNYYYANVSANGHAEFFLDEIAAYDGDPDKLSENLRDCFDTYDDNMFLKTRVQQKFAVLMSESGFVNIHESQKIEGDKESLKAFHYGFHYDIEKYDQPTVTVSDGTPLKDFLKKGEEGKLDGNDKLAYETYEKMLAVAYDVVSEIMREAALAKTIDLPVVFSASSLGVSATSVALDVLDSVLEDAIENDNYSFDINTRYPNGFFNAMAEEYNVPEGVFDTLFCYSIRISFAGTAFCHPNVNGYKEICDIVWDSYVNHVHGDDAIRKATRFDYNPYVKDPYYFAIGQLAQVEGSYAEILAEKINAEGFSTFDNSGHRASELLSILDDNYKLDGYGKAQIEALKEKIFEDFKADIDDEKALERINSLSESERAELVDELYEDFRKDLIKKIKKSDIISVDMGIDDFTTFALNQITAKLLSEIGDDDSEKFIGGILSNVISQYEMYEMDWSRFEDILGEIDRDAIIEKLRDVIIEKGIPEYYEEAFTVSVMTITVKISPADIASYAAEALLYTFVNYMHDYSEAIKVIHSINPDAEVVMLGEYNTIDGLVAEFGDFSMDLSAVGQVVVYAMNTQTIVYAMTMPKTTYVSIEDARKGIEPLTLSDIVNIDFENFSFQGVDWANFKLFNTEAFDLPEAANEYVAEQLYSAINFVCYHEYDGCLDAECNICLETRTDYGHRFGDWTETKPATLTEAGEKQRVCTVCGAVETAEIEKLADDNDGDTSDTGSDEETDAPSDDSGDGKDKKSNVGAIIGISAGSAVALGGGGFAVYWFAIRKKKII